MIENLQSDLWQAFQIFRIERRGPRRILAHDHRCFHVELTDKKIFSRRAH